MILTGRSTSSTKFYPQTGFSYSFETEEMNDLTLSFTGPTSYSGSFKFLSGKVYNTTGQFVSVYNSGDPFKFDFAFKTGLYTTWFNDKLTEAGRSFSSVATNYLTGFSMTGTSPYNTSLDVSLYGTRPSLYFSPIYTTNLTNFTGYVLITGFPGELYSIDPLNASGLVTTVGKFTSGNFTITGNGFNTGSIINTNFNFDFGEHNENLVVYYDPGTTQSGYIDISSNGTTFITGTPYTQYQDFNISSIWPASTNFETYLQFLYRSGYTAVYGTGVGSGRYSGYISGSGYLTGTSISGSVTTGYFYQYTGTVPTGFSPSILMTGTGALFAYATGQIVYDFLVETTGEEYLHPSFGGLLKPVTGYIMGTATGYVGLGSGHYIFVEPVVGRYISFSGEYSIGNGLNRGFHDPIINPDSYYSDGSREQTGYINHTGVLATTMYNYLGTGGFTGQAPAALVYSTDTGLITGFNYRTGEYHHFTGDYSSVNSAFYDYAANGFRNGAFIRKASTDSISGGVYEIGARITYDRQIPWGVIDYVKLVAKNDNTTVEKVPQGYSL